MVLRNGRNKLAGFVIHNGQRYVFKSKRGEEFDIVQDAQAEKLARTKELCIFEDVPSKNPNDKFGRILKVIGKGGDIIPEGRAIAESYNLIQNMPYDVKKEVASIPTYVSAKDGKDFADLRHIPFCTIDPDTAKDYDDAVWAKKNPDGSYELKVAIANVSHYVPHYSNLFDYAIDNGNSKYLGATVYPMLPEKLSNGICSLNEQVNRLTMCTTCTINPDGTISNYKIEPAVINSRHRLTYKEADYIHFGKNAPGDNADHKGIVAQTIDVKDSLDCLLEVSEILFDARMKRGAFDIDEKEFEFKYTPDGLGVEDYTRAHNEKYTSVIEETAIITNEIWGEVAKKLGVPFDYRNHIMIQDQRLTRELQTELKKYNINLPNHFGGKNIQKIINSVKGKKIEDYIVKTLLTAMKPATYSSENCGHIGLGVRCENNPEKQNINSDARIDEARTRYFKENGTPYGLSFDGDITHSAYGHTTSPIRRGSDLVNQTQFMSVIMDNKVLFSETQIDDMSQSFNYNERLSKMAEQDYNDMLFALWAKNNIGRTFENCYIVDLSERNAIVMTPDGIKFVMPYTTLNFDKKYLKIGKELRSVTINSVSLYPPKIIAVPTPYNTINRNENNAENATQAEKEF